MNVVAEGSFPKLKKIQLNGGLSRCDSQRTCKVKTFLPPLLASKGNQLTVPNIQKLCFRREWFNKEEADEDDRCNIIALVERAVKERVKLNVECKEIKCSQYINNEDVTSVCGFHITALASGNI